MKRNVMNDQEIIALYWAKEERAISATAEKYGNYCHIIAYNILYDYFDAEECVNDTVLISFDQKLSGDEKLKESVSEVVKEALEKTKSVHTVVYADATDNDETAAIAKKYGVSQGKAQLIADAKKNSSMSEEEIANLPLDELVGLQKNVNSTVIDSEYIGILKAKAIALNDSGCAARVEFTEARLIDKGAKYPYYRLVFNDKRTQWTYLSLIHI